MSQHDYRHLTIGTTEHRALRGKYRTFCGSSVEYANRREATDECQVCADPYVECGYCYDTVRLRDAEQIGEGATASFAHSICHREAMDELEFVRVSTGKIHAVKKTYSAGVELMCRTDRDLVEGTPISTNLDMIWRNDDFCAKCAAKIDKVLA